MKVLADWLWNRNVAWAVVILAGVLTVGALLQLRHLKQQDDVLSFMPQDNPEVKLFYDINDRFGGLDVALVGIETEDAFDAGFLARLQRVTNDLKDEGGLNHVVSLTNVIDITPDLERGGVITAPLVQYLPKTVAEREALRAKVMSRDHVVGNLISSDGRAVLVYGFLAYGADPKAAAARVRNIVSRTMPDQHVYWGGGPFITAYIFETTQKDLRRLTPWAVLAIVVIMMLSFWEFIGAMLALLTTGIGIAWSIGLMAVLEVPFNIALSAMPVILFAIGSAYGIHLLSRYYALAERHDPRIAMARTMSSLGPVVLGAGLTTVASLVSFVFMDIQPIRMFGLFTGLGILATLLLSLTFIPAAIRLLGLRRRQASSLMLRAAMVRLTVFAQRKRWPVGVGLLMVAAVGVLFVTRVNTSVDQTTFFSKGSPPDEAERFLRQHFGGSQFVEVFVEGDMTDPHVLREVRRMADRIALLPHVSSVQHVGDALALSNEAMAGQRRIPDTADQARLVYTFLIGDAAVAQLINADRTQGLIHVKVDSNRAAVLEKVLQGVEQLLATQMHARFEVAEPGHPRWTEARAALVQDVVWRLRAIARAYDVVLPAAAPMRLPELLDQSLDPAPLVELVSAKVANFLRSEECAVALPALDGAGDPAARIAAAMGGLGHAPDEPELVGRLRALLPASADEAADALLAEDLSLSLAGPLAEMWRQARAEQRLAGICAGLGLNLPAGGRGERMQIALAGALWDLENPTVAVPLGSGPGGVAALASAPDAPMGQLRMQANGMPVMHRGLSRSVQGNQVRSLIFALVVVILILSVLFRSLTAGLLAAAPTVLTLILIYGGMGLLRVHLDIGTSMLASIITGIGVDYAVHLMSAWNPSNDSGSLVGSAALAADRTGPAIWTNAIMIFAGFVVLTMGEARPLQNVGGLTAAAMLVAALATFLTIPVLARKLRYRPLESAADELEASAAVEAVLGEQLAASEKS